MHLLKLVIFLIVMPLVFVFISAWQGNRSTTALKQAQQAFAEVSQRAEHERFASVQLSPDGPVYSAELAASYLKEIVQVQSMRNKLPWWASVCGIWASILGLLGLLLTAILGYVGRQSRQALVRVFSVAFRLLPLQMIVQMVLIAAAFASVVAFETIGIWHPGHLSNSEVKGLALFGFLSLLGFGFVGTALKRMKSLFKRFESSPTELYGREVRGQEANLLWVYVGTLAKRIGALLPEHIVVGLMKGFFVTSNPIYLKPENRTITGRTLYIPLPYLALLNENEVKAIIGHELGHFSGEDTTYSEHFIPIYVGIERSLQAVSGGSTSDFFSKIFVYPVFLLAHYFMMQFEFAVKHWSRLREFAADAVGANVGGAQSIASSLIRVSVVSPRIQEAISTACENPHSAPADLLAEVLRLSREKGFDDPNQHLEDEQSHPTDTHPPTRQRIEALGETITAALLRLAARPVESETSLVTHFFGDASALCKRLTSDLTGAVIAHEKAVDAKLEQQVARVIGEYTIMESTTGIVRLFFIIALFLLIPATFIGVHAFIVGKFAFFEVATLIPLLLFGAFCFWWMSVLQKQALIPVMTLSPKGIRVHGIEPEVAWGSVADFRIVIGQYGVATLTFDLSPDHPLPNYVGGIKRRTALKPKKRQLLVKFGALKGLDAHKLAALLLDYLRGNHAANVLRERREAEQQRNKLLSEQS